MNHTASVSRTRQEESQPASVSPNAPAIDDLESRVRNQSLSSADRQTALASILELGSTETMKLLINFASDRALGPELQKQAIEALGAYTVYFEEARDALVGIAKNSLYSVELRETALLAAAILGNRSFGRQAFELLQDEALPSRVRIQTLNSLAAINYREATNYLVQTLADSQITPAFKEAALRALAQSQDPQAAATTTLLRAINDPLVSTDTKKVIMAHLERSGPEAARTL